MWRQDERGTILAKDFVHYLETGKTDFVLGGVSALVLEYGFSYDIIDSEIAKEIFEYYMITSVLAPNISIDVQHGTDISGRVKEWGKEKGLTIQEYEINRNSMNYNGSVTYMVSDKKEPLFSVTINPTPGTILSTAAAGKKVLKTYPVDNILIQKSMDLLNKEDLMSLLSIVVAGTEHKEKISEQTLAYITYTLHSFGVYRYNAIMKLTEANVLERDNFANCFISLWKDLGLDLSRLKRLARNVDRTVIRYDNKRVPLYNFDDHFDND